MSVHNGQVNQLIDIRKFWLSNSENFTALMMILLILECISMIGDNK